MTSGYLLKYNMPEGVIDILLVYANLIDGSCYSIKSSWVLSNTFLKYCTWLLFFLSTSFSSKSERFEVFLQNELNAYSKIPLRFFKGYYSNFKYSDSQILIKFKIYSNVLSLF